MKKNFICMYLFLSATLASCQSCSSDYKDVDDIVVEGVETPVPLGDPFIMLYEGTYYAYGTHADDGIEVYTSDDLQTWKYKGMALQKKDVWADRWFWAPEVYEVNGKFYMYYSADEHICVATADSPAGPFTQSKKEPQIADEKCIDNSLFIDDDAHLISFSTVSTTDSTLGGRIGERPHDYQEGDHASLHSRFSGMGGSVASCE